MRTNKNKFLIPLFLLCLTSCGTFSGNFRFNNEGDKNINVSRLVGFESEPPVGILIPHAHSGASMHRMKFPSVVTIYWSYGWNVDGLNKSVVSLTSIKPPQGDSAIVFIFSPDYKWYAKTED